MRTSGRLAWKDCGVSRRKSCPHFIKMFVLQPWWKMTDFCRRFKEREKVCLIVFVLGEKLPKVFSRFARFVDQKCKQHCFIWRFVTSSTSASNLRIKSANMLVTSQVAPSLCRASNGQGERVRRAVFGKLAENKKILLFKEEAADISFSRTGSRTTGSNCFNCLQSFGAIEKPKIENCFSLISSFTAISTHFRKTWETLRKCQTCVSLVENCQLCAKFGN